MNNDEIILSMETAIRGGSISILRGGREIDYWTGGGELPKSDDILYQISILLRKNNVEKREIRFIAVSTGPGSFTGLRIGLALARGLRRSLDCSIKGVSVLEALTLKTNYTRFILTAIPFGNNQIYWQLFKFL
jgi:tRNA threonylcarbamoyladenosine biosynthesis protein TsaB